MFEDEEKVESAKKSPIRLSLFAEEITTCGGDYDSAAVGSLLERLMNTASQLLHFRGAGRNGVVNKHGCVEIAVLKRWRDASQVHAYTVAAGSVGGIVGQYLDLSAYGVEQEVVRGSRLRKAHAFIAAFVGRKFADSAAQSTVTFAFVRDAGQVGHRKIKG